MRLWAVIALITIIYGCKGPVRPPESSPPSEPEVFAGTIGSLCELSGYAGVRVRGYGLVVALADTGSEQCPEPQKSHLVHQLRQLKAQGYIPKPYANLTAEQLLVRKDTAAVLVRGLIPPGAPKGERFNVEVTVLAGTQTGSLQGGVLLPMELQIIRPGRGGRILAARPTARAAGMVFVNPFGEKDTPSADARRGVVLGGARSLYARQIQLSILRPNYRIAQQIQKRINARFDQPEGVQVADAADYSRVLLTVPQTYRRRYGHFISLVWALYLRDSASFEAQKLQEIKALLQSPEADYEKIALAWEGIGQAAKGDLYDIYSGSADEELAFYAARTALDLGNRKAIDKLAAMALNDRTTVHVRTRAAEALGRAVDDARARAALRKLLNKGNTTLRIRAYEALRQAKSSEIRSVPMPGGFTLDVVESTGPQLICAWAGDEGRIVLFGRAMRCRDSVFFKTADEHVMINAHPGDHELMITRQRPGKDELWTASCPLTVESLVKTLADQDGTTDKAENKRWSLGFSEITDILRQLCQAEAIAAEFVLERAGE